MSTYLITLNTTSGKISGLYDGDDQKKAIDALAQDAGYKDTADMLGTLHETSTDDLFVEAIIPADISDEAGDLMRELAVESGEEVEDYGEDTNTVWRSTLNELWNDLTNTVYQDDLTGIDAAEQAAQGDPAALVWCRSFWQISPIV